MSDKPHHGRVKDWVKEPCDSGLGYLIVGEFLDHPHFRGPRCHTSYLVAHNSETGEIETKNSRYTLVDDGEPTRMPGWPWKGDRMIFLGKNGYERELTEAQKMFEVGKEYEVEDILIGAWSHTLSFVGIPGRYNGVMFESVTLTSADGRGAT